MSPRLIQRLRIVAIGFVAMLATLLGAGTASAHSAVIASTPANGSEIAAAPDRVSLTFNEALQAKFATLTVVGPGEDRALWSKGDPTVQGDTVSVPLEGLGPAGVYTIAYRVTSADGHPVSGTQTFTLTQDGTGTPGPQVGGQTDGSSSDDSGPNLMIWVIVVAAVLVFGGGLWFALRKPRGEN
ncbi:hypothetical protein C8K36_10630 [Rhodococcus sp. OK519]|uniref:copper resistance CopC family protein n=1 Tax=Rhodococcus sp. OK519 TaxID=2135729 RepID=UPI000D39C6AF|nr:hypothetical protein C8K36_10630 [Rhodococcus sp. OK519]